MNQSQTRHSTGTVVSIILCFLSLNLAIYIFSPSDSYIAGDTSSYLEPALRLLQEGRYSSDSRLPVYPGLLALCYAITSKGVGVVVFCQTLILLGTALIAMKLSEQFLPRYRLLVFAITAFNPLALLYVQRILPENVFSFLFILHLFFLIRAYRDNSLMNAVFAGMCAGLIGLTRPNGMFIVLVMPILMFLGGRLAPVRCPYRKLVLFCGVSFVVALMLLGPWIYHQKSETKSWGMLPGKYRNHNIYMNLVFCEMRVSSLSRNKAEKVINQKLQQISGATDFEWARYTQNEVEGRAVNHAVDLISDYPPLKLIGGMSKAVVIFLLSNGASTWQKIFGIKTPTVEKLQLSSEPTISNFLSRVALKNVENMFSYGINLGFLFSIRVLNVLGLLALIRKRNWEVLGIFGGYVVLFAFVIGFQGYSRYRLPLDPIFSILAAWGVYQCRLMFGKKGESMHLSVKDR